MIFKPPQKITTRDHQRPSVFLAGSIEMGKAEDWQNQATELLRDQFDIFNPRRDAWDASWEQLFENPQFFQQVTWELDCLKVADAIIMYFDKDTMSPISLLEFGLYAPTSKLYVVCPDGFWRKGNVEIVSHHYKIPEFSTLESACSAIKYAFK